MFFSVILPTFNSSSFIDKALQSLMSQTYRKFEVIASDDGSKDNTVRILKKYKKLFKKKKIDLTKIENFNFGPGYARKKAIKKSKYEWLAFLDSDDVWHKDKLLKVYKKLNVAPIKVKKVKNLNGFFEDVIKILIAKSTLSKKSLFLFTVLFDLY